MTVNEIAQRLARWTTFRSLSQMAAEDQLILLDCINSAMHQWFSQAPENMRMTTISHRVREPESGTVSITEGSNDLDLVLSDYHLGASIEITGEDVMNEIVSVEGTPKVLNEFRSSGTVGYTIYFDTIMFTDYLVNRIVNDPRVADTGQRLIRDDEAMRFVGAERRGIGLWGPASWWSVTKTRRFGPPMRYVIENTGVSLGDEARLMIRLDPVPTAEATIVMDAVIDAANFELTDLHGTSNVRIPIPEQNILSALLPIANAELAMTPIWGINERSRTEDVLERKAQALMHIRKSVQPNRGAPKNRVRTRPGY